jgi:hypothetical protein
MMKHLLLALAFCMACFSTAHGDAPKTPDLRLHTVVAADSTKFTVELDDGSIWNFNYRTFPYWWSVSDGVFVLPTANPPLFQVQMSNTVLQSTVICNNCTANKGFAGYILTVADGRLTLNDGTRWIVDWSNTQLWKTGDFIGFGGKPVNDEPAEDFTYLINLTTPSATKAKLQQ